jgi:hypothetical protein
MISRIFAYCLMIILLAAHFSRANNDILAVLSLMVPLLLFVKQKWVIDTLEMIAYLSAVVWLYGAYHYIQIRIATGDDWGRLLLIMGAVALFSAWSGYFLRSPKLMDVYGTKK